MRRKSYVRIGSSRPPESPARRSKWPIANYELRTVNSPAYSLRRLRDPHPDRFVVWKEQLEHGPRGAAGFRCAAAYVYVGLVFLDNLHADPQPEAGSGVFLGGEECFEDAVADLGRHAVARIGNREPDPCGSAAARPVTRTAGANDHAPPSGGGVDGVVDQVRQHLPHFTLEAEQGG